MIFHKSNNHWPLFLSSFYKMHSMHRYISIGLLLLFFTNISPAQERIVISGYVRDAETGEALIGANIALRETGRGTIANQYGFYSLSLKPGFYNLVFSYVGYTTDTRAIRLGEDTQLTIEIRK